MSTIIFSTCDEESHSGEEERYTGTGEEQEERHTSTGEQERYSVVMQLVLVSILEVPSKPTCMVMILNKESLYKYTLTTAIHTHHFLNKSIAAL